LKGVKFVLAAMALVAVASTSVHAADVMDGVAQSVAQNLRKNYPNTQFQKVSATPLAGIFEVVMGRNTAYTDASGRYFLFGHLFDMQKQVDLTAAQGEEPTQEKTRINFKDLPLDKAIKTVRGDGKRVVAVFSDPECPYCKKLEPELEKLNNITVYTFLFPLDSLHPDSPAKATAIWCQADRAAAWREYMLHGKLPEQPTAKDCKPPLIAVQALAAKYRINGTPFLISADGRTMPGAASSERLEAFIGARP
jgi:thiol:disulfide interchange protein DsbC